MRTQIIKELTSCDRADWLVSFIKYAGILPLLPTLHEFTQNPASDGGPRLRIATTSYMGATDIKAVEALLKLPEVLAKLTDFMLLASPFFKGGLRGLIISMLSIS